jgi:hypothetical protein
MEKSVRLPSILGVVYLVIGIVVANSKNYFENLDAAKPLVSAVLAVVLWPLLLLGVNLHIK